MGKEDELNQKMTDKVTPSGYVTVPVGKEGDTTLLVEPKNLPKVLDNVHQVKSMREHEADTKPASKKS